MLIEYLQRIIMVSQLSQFFELQIAINSNKLKDLIKCINILQTISYEFVPGYFLVTHKHPFYNWLFYLIMFYAVLHFSYYFISHFSTLFCLSTLVNTACCPVATPSSLFPLSLSTILYRKEQKSTCVCVTEWQTGKFRAAFGALNHSC